VTDDLLTSIDQAFAAQLQAKAPKRIVLRKPVPQRAADEEKVVAPAEGAASLWDRMPWIEGFLAVQFLWGAVLFIPGAQEYRGVVRALPYVSSLGLLALYALHRVPRALPRGSALLVGGLLLLVLNLFNSRSQLAAGLAQCVFQLSIAAPLFWGYKAIRSSRHVERLIVLMFFMNFASAGLGVLQVYYPDRFMPPEFSSFGLELNEYYVASLTYIGSDGRAIIRPPGLTDQPGGAAVAGGLTALLGLGLLLRARRPLHVAGLLGAVTVGLAVIYLTQVRSVLLIGLGAGAVLCAIAVRRGRVAGATWILAAGAALVVASFIWASSLGGAAVDNRFLNLQGRGAIEAYQDNRGNFLAYTVGELLDEFPFGAGVGRWGVMNTYFGDPADSRSAPIHVEIQLTGWLLDGGVPMWVLYGGAVLMALWVAFMLTGARDRRLAETALIVLALEVFVVGMAMAGPVFNTQLGILFWMLGSSLHGASRADREMQRRELETP
jgi:hypothetical protein